MSTPGSSAVDRVEQLVKSMERVRGLTAVMLPMKPDDRLREAMSWLALGLIAGDEYELVRIAFMLLPKKAT